MTDTKQLKDEELKQVSGGTGLIMDAEEIHNILRACGDLAWARNHYSTLWSAINYAQAVGMCQTRLDKINEALNILKAQGLTAGLSQNDYDILLNDLTRCKYAVEKALTPHRR